MSASVCLRRVVSWSRYKISCSKFNLKKRLFASECSEHTKSFSVTYSEFGDPRKVLSGENSAVRDVHDNEILIKMLMAPINPADINKIEGKYPELPKLPAIVGNEGVGEVVAIGNAVNLIKPGNIVLPMTTEWGTWRTHGVLDAANIQVVPDDVPLISAATITVNMCTAFRMLKDFNKMGPGDVVIQNGANSAAGQAVIQLASHWGIKTINVVRKRPDLENLVSALKSLGATHVVTEEYCRTPEMKELIKSFEKPPKLALNCVGGKSATELLRHLGNRGTLVTYGGMSKQPVIVPTGVLIFKEIKLAGYWMTKWSIEHRNSSEKDAMYKELFELCKQHKLQAPPCQLVPIADFKDAIIRATEGYTGHKQVLVMDKRYLPH